MIILIPLIRMTLIPNADESWRPLKCSGWRWSEMWSERSFWGKVNKSFVVGHCTILSKAVFIFQHLHKPKFIFCKILKALKSRTVFVKDFEKENYGQGLLFSGLRVFTSASRSCLHWDRWRNFWNDRGADWRCVWVGLRDHWCHHRLHCRHFRGSHACCVWLAPSRLSSVALQWLWLLSLTHFDFRDCYA